MFERYCKTCGFRSPESVCRITGLQVDPANDYCSRHLYETLKCDGCGAIVLPTTSVICGSRIYCFDCYNAWGTCKLCYNARQCAFESDPSDLPKVIPIIQQQGNMRIQTQAMNPDRIAITCAKGCRCYNQETKSCARQHGECANFVEQEV